MSFGFGKPKDAAASDGDKPKPGFGFATPAGGGTATESKPAADAAPAASSFGASKGFGATSSSAAPPSASAATAGFGGGGGNSGGSGFGATATATTAASSGVATAAAAPPYLMPEIRKALQSCWISESLSKVIQSRFSSPFAASATSSLPTNPQCVQFDITAIEILTLLRGDAKVVGNLAPTLAGIAGPLMSNMCAFLLSMTQYTSLPAITWGNEAGASSDRHRMPGVTQSSLLVAQCVFLLTQQFQLQEKHIKELTATLHALLAERVKTAADTVVGSPSEVGATATLYLLSMSLLNALSPQPSTALRGANGDLTAANALLGNTAVASGLRAWISDAKASLASADSADSGSSGGGAFSNGGFGGAKGGFGAARGEATGAGAVRHASHARAMAGDAVATPSPAEAFISIATLALGIFTLARDRDSGLDVVLEAFRGDRGESPLLGGSLSVSFGGRVSRHLYKHIPPPGVLVIERRLLCEAAFRAVEYVLTHALPVIRWVADLDIASYRSFLQSVVQHQAMESEYSNGQYNNNNYYGGSGAYGAVARGAGAYPPYQQHHGGPRRGPTPQLTPFGCDTAHLLKLLNVCSAELPPSWFKESSVTHFIFSNLVIHMRQVFDTHKTQSQWEAYTLKLCTSYFQLLHSLSRDSEIAQRVYCLGFADCHVQCSDLRWTSVINQCRECTGVTQHGGYHAAFTDDDATRTRSRFGREAKDDQRRFSGPVLGDRIAATQMTAEYHDQKQRKFTASVFSLLAQLSLSLQGASAATLQHFDCGDDVENGIPDIQRIITLDDVFQFIVAPRLNQRIAGMVFTLLGTMMTSRELVHDVWRRALDMQLFNLHSAPIRDPALTSTGSGGGSGSGSGSGGWGYIASSGQIIAGGGHGGGEGHDIASHCAQEMRMGSYHLTKGFLRFLFIALRFVDTTFVPGGPTCVRALIKFVATDIVCGVSHRTYAHSDDMYEVAALGFAVLTRGFERELCGSDEQAFHDIMATDRAPSSVIADVTHFIHVLSKRDATRTPAAICCLRHALELLTNALALKNRLLIDLFTFDARTVISEDFAGELLWLMTIDDPVVVQHAAGAATSVHDVTMSQAIQALMQTHVEQGDYIMQVVACLLRGDIIVLGGHFTTPQSLQLVETAHSAPSLESADSRVKARLIDLLLRFVAKPLPSLTSWLCGYDIHGTSHIPLHQHSCLLVVLHALNDVEFLRGHPNLAVRYAALVHAVMAYPPMYTASLRAVLRGREAAEYWNAVYAVCGRSAGPGNATPPEDLHRFGLILKSMSLELFHATDADDELLLPHLRRMLWQQREDDGGGAMSRFAGGEYGGGDGSGSSSALAYSAAAARALGEHGDHGIEQAVDFAMWVPEVVTVLPPLPELDLPFAVDAVLYHSSEHVPQYNVVHANVLLQQMDPQSSPERRRRVLEPLCAANECLQHHHKAAVFVEGWCQLVEMMCAKAPSALLALPTVVRLLDVSVKSITMTAEGTNVWAYERLSTALSRASVALVAVIRERATARIGQGAALASAVSSAPAARGSTRFEAGAAAHDRSVHGRAEDHQREAVAGAEALSPSEAAVLNDTLRVLLNIVVGLGRRTLALRYNLNMSLLILLSLPGVGIETLTMMRIYDGLFPLLVEDITSTATSLPIRIVSLHALLRVLNADKAAVRVFATTRSSSSSSALMSAFVEGVLSVVDRVCLSEASATRGTPSSSTFNGDWAATINCHTDAVFDVLSVIAQTNPLHLHATNVASLLASMTCWEVLHSNMSGGRHRSFLVGQRLLLASMRFLNVLLRNMPQHEGAAMACAQFVRMHQALLQHIFADVAHQARIGVHLLTLELAEQALLMFLLLARTTSIHGFAPELISIFSLTDTLRLLSLPELRHGPIFVPEAGSLAQSADGVSSLALPSPSQARTLSQSLLYLLYFLLCCFDAAVASDFLSSVIDTAAGGTPTEAEAALNAKQQHRLSASLAMRLSHRRPSKSLAPPSPSSASVDAATESGKGSMSGHGLTGELLMGVFRGLAATLEENVSPAGVRACNVHCLAVTAHLLQLQLVEEEGSMGRGERMRGLGSSGFTIQPDAPRGAAVGMLQQQQQQRGGLPPAAHALDLVSATLVTLERERQRHSAAVSVAPGGGRTAAGASRAAAWGLDERRTHAADVSEPNIDASEAAALPLLLLGSLSSAAALQSMINDTRNVILHLQSALTRLR